MNATTSQLRISRHSLAVLGLLLAFALVALLGPLAGVAFAASSGEFGTNCEWEIDSRKMTIGPKVVGEEASFDGNDWNSLKNRIGKSSFQYIVSFKVEDGVKAVGSLDSMFYNCTELASANLSELDTSEVTSMEGTFRGCSSLESLDLSGWDVSRVTNMKGMFSMCSSLKTLGVSEWNTSNVTSTGSAHYATRSGMFYGCSSLEALDVSRWDVSNLSYASNMFYGCSSLQSLDVSKWDTSKLYDARNMFAGCSSLKLLDLSGWNGDKLSNETYEEETWELGISYCNNLSELKIGAGLAAYYAKISVQQALTEKLPAGDWYLNGGSTKCTTIQPGKAGTYRKIIPEELDADNVTLSYTATGEVLDTGTSAVKKYPAATYNGKKQTPTITVRNEDGTKLTKDTHYTVSYSSSTRKYVGTYTVTIKGKGKYTGTVKKTFIIKPKATSIYSATATAGGFKMKWSKRTSQTSGYELRYGIDSSFVKSSYDTCRIVSNETCYKRVTDLGNKAKYYGKVRAYKNVDGKRYYSSWSAAKSVTTK